MSRYVSTLLPEVEPRHRALHREGYRFSAGKVVHLLLTLRPSSRRAGAVQEVALPCCIGDEQVRGGVCAAVKNIEGVDPLRDQHASLSRKTGQIGIAQDPHRLILA